MNAKSNNSGMSGGLSIGRGTGLEKMLLTPEVKKKKTKKTLTELMIEVVGMNQFSNMKSWFRAAGVVPKKYERNNEGIASQHGLENKDWTEVGFASVEAYSKCYQHMSGGCEDHVSEVSIATGGVNQNMRFYSNVSLKVGKEVLGFPRALAELGFSSVPGFSDSALCFNQKNQPTAYIHMTARTFSDIRVHTTSREMMDKIIAIFGEFFTMPDQKSILTKITGISPRGLSTTSEVMDHTEDLSPACFYPWMNGYPVQDYFQEFLDSKDSVLLLYGLPGTGKSSLIRTGLITTGSNAHLVADSSIASNPEFLTHLATSLSENTEGDSILIVEDADAMIRPRSDGNMGLNVLLDAAAGVGKRGGFKLILTTNAKDTSGIDAALLRPGRCFDIMQFGTLTPEQAATVRETVGKPARNITSEVTLAVAMSAPGTSTMKSGQDETTSIVAPRFPLRKAA